MKINKTTAVSEVVRKIQTAYQLQNEYYEKSCEQVIVIGRHLVDMDEYFESDPDAEMDFLEKLPFSASLASKYKQVARHPVLSNKKHLKSLPSSLSTLYELSKSSEENLLEAIRSGLIGLGSTRADASKFALNNPKAKSGGRGAPVKSGTALNFSQIKIASDCDEDEQDAILEALMEIKKIHPAFSLKISKDVANRYKGNLLDTAKNALQAIIENQNPDKQKLSNLLSTAVFEARKNKNFLPKNFKWRQRLEKEAGVDVSGDVKVSQLYKVLRNEGIISRYTPVSDHDPIASVWVLVIDYCEGDKGALTRLRKFSVREVAKPSAKFIKAQELALKMIEQIETL